MHIGCHVSIAGGVQNAPQRAADLNCEVMQIFTRSPQGGKAPEFTPEIIKKFKLQATSYKLQAIYVHAPYYINLASANNRIRYGSASAIREELERADSLGAKYVLTHLGSAGEITNKNALEKASSMLVKSLDGYNGKCRLLLENSAGSGKIIGGDLKDLSEIIKITASNMIAGICLDTQHSFASGYDWRDFENNLKKIDTEVGLEKIKLIHANDSLTECGSKKDRHAHIGKGLIGIEAFRRIVAFAQKNEIDMILETEHSEVAEDIETLKKIRKSP